MLYTLKVYTTDLDVGMYVSALDRPWLDTPFVTQGFVLESQDDIDRVRKYCDFVYIDTVRSRKGAAVRRKMGAALSRTVTDGGKSAKERPRIPIERIFKGRKLHEYRDEVSWQEEAGCANLALDSLVADISEIFDHVSDGGSLDVIRLKGAVSPIVESMGRNPDACMWLSRLKKHDEYSYQHSLSASIWAVALGRQLGLGRLDLRSLAIGGMLMDVGKLRVNPELLKATRPLSDRELAEVREHVENGVELLRDSGMINQDVLDMVAHHHERYDGSGYPQGLRGQDIPPVACIAAIVDTYDALTSHRSYAPAVSPSEAIRIIYRARDVEFQAELVEAFIQAVGIYPAGTLVELTSGEVGVVVAEYRTRRLLPKITLLLDENKRRIARPKMVDLLIESETEDGQGRGIRKSLEPGAYGIDLSELDHPAA
jgi:HD-GYP domain-containing protein (c-di-GMP phosphodiesterase class II)